MLPKSHNNSVEISPLVNNKIVTQTSHSLSKYHDDLQSQLVKFKKEDINHIVSKSTPSGDLFFSKTKFSASKSAINPKTSLFFELLEVILSLNIWFADEIMNCMHIGANCDDSRMCIQLVREENNNKKNDNNNCFEFVCEEIFNIINEKRYNFIFYETTNCCSINTYVLELLQCLMVLLKYQIAGGGCIIKVDHTSHKPVVDVLYILSCIYDKVYVIKPSTCNIISFERFIVCKNFLLNDKKKQAYKAYYFKIGDFINFYKQTEDNNNNISSIIDIDVPYLFLNKVDDINIIFGQQQLEHINQVINVFKSKNPDEKMESIKKANNQKTIINWSEKITERTNIFLKQKVDDKGSSTAERNCFL